MAERPARRFFVAPFIVAPLVAASVATCAVAFAPATGFAAVGPVVDRAKLIPLSPAIVKIEARIQNGRLQVGTGVTVARGVVVTNCHVVANAERVTVSKRAGSWRAVAQHAAGDHDLCFLSIPNWRATPIPIAVMKPPRLRQPAVALGYTGGVELSLSEGRIDAVYPYQNSFLLQTTTSFSSGASGGALLDHDGQLLGVLTFRMRGLAGHYYAVPASWIEDDLPGESNWRPIGSPIDRPPFWRGDVDTLPYFMRAAPLEAEQRWADLLRLGDLWRDAEPISVEPQFVRSRALARLERHAEAIDALRDVVRRDPGYAKAWLQLGIEYLRTEHAPGQSEVSIRLGALDAELGAEFERLRTRASGPGVRQQGGPS